jgi:hypothetical protein
MQSAMLPGSRSTGWTGYGGQLRGGKFWLFHKDQHPASPGPKQPRFAQFSYYYNLPSPAPISLMIFELLL